MSSVATAIVASAGLTYYGNKKSADAQKKAAKQQAALAAQAEKQRQAEAAAEAERQRQAEERRQNNITQGSNEISSVFGQFDDNFYNQRSQGYLDYALPQLDQQYQDEQRQLIAQLARTGNLNSSLRGDLSGKLLGQYNTNKLNLQNTANSYASSARSAVEQARAQLLKSNSELADPGLIRTMADAQASGVKVAPQYQSLGDMIANLSATLTPNAAATAGTPSGTGVELYNKNSNTAGSSRLVS